MQNLKEETEVNEKAFDKTKVEVFTLVAEVDPFVGDFSGAELDDENFKKFLDYLRRLDAQIVMTSSSRFNEYFGSDYKKIDMNIFLKKE
jgi:hypothetical protein